mmetsp:Transcript_89829/g.178574  ORF Transcript_89829/g.178574 Transcript_89829/m.178574 type:complete len:121 (-) Transcript_89829:117-479(-)
MGLGARGTGLGERPASNGPRDAIPMAIIPGAGTVGATGEIALCLNGEVRLGDTGHLGDERRLGGDVHESRSAQIPSCGVFLLTAVAVCAAVGNCCLLVAAGADFRGSNGWWPPTGPGEDR